MPSPFWKRRHLNIWIEKHKCQAQHVQDRNAYMIFWYVALCFCFLFFSEFCYWISYVFEYRIQPKYFCSIINPTKTWSALESSERLCKGWWVIFLQSLSGETPGWVNCCLKVNLELGGPTSSCIYSANCICRRTCSRG